MTQTRREFFMKAAAAPMLVEIRRRTAAASGGARPVFRIEAGEPDTAIIKAEEIDGHLEFYVEGINVASPGFEPAGVEVVVNDPKAAVLGKWPGPGKQRNNPTILFRGPETQLKAFTDHHSESKGISDTEFELRISTPGLFRYQARLLAAADAVTVEARLTNESSWDWRDAYSYFHWGIAQCPTFEDFTGDRTILFTAAGLRRASQLRHRFWTSLELIERYDVAPCANSKGNCFLFRPTAQYYEPEGRWLPRTEDGFDYDMCGISPDRVTAGLSLRLEKAGNGDRVLAICARRFRAIFTELADVSRQPKASQCIHVDPSAGDLLIGETAELRGALFLMKGTAPQVAREAARRAGIPLESLRR